MSEPLRASMPAADKRTIALSLGRMSLAVASLLCVYFLMPLNGRDNAYIGLVAVVIGLTIFVAIFVRQLRQIGKASYPVLRAVEAIVLVTTLFVIVMSSVHYGLGQQSSDNYSEAMTRLDALYFTVTTVATVGFGDITPTAQVTRAVTTIQMVLGVVLLGAGVRILVGVAQRVSQERRAASHR